MKKAAGTLLYRHREGRLEVLLVHPSGAYNAHKPWSIPKGEPDDGETLEEAGVMAGALVPLGFVTYQKSGKRVHGFAGTCAEGEPFCACWEVDQAQFVPIDQARQMLHPDQRPLLDRLETHLAEK